MTVPQRLAYAPSDPPEIASRLWQGWQGNTAFYVGANMGQNLAELASRFHRIFCFEPNPRSYEVLSRLAANYDGPIPGGVRPQIDVMNMAVSSKNGTLELANLPGTRQEDTGQFVTIGHRGMEWDPVNWGDKNRVERVTVACMTLDSLTASLGDPDFVSIDTEGHEFIILQGASDTIAKARPGFLIEFHSPENYDSCRHLLSDFNYHVDTVRHPHYARHTPMWRQHGWLRARPLPPTSETEL